MRTLNSSGAGKITHVVYIVQENRSFDNMFQGYPGAGTRSYGYDSSGKKIELRPYPLGTPYGIDHLAEVMFEACNGNGTLPGTDCRMNGFNNEQPCCVYPNPQYVYVPHSHYG